MGSGAPPVRDKLPTLQDLDVFTSGAPRATSQHPPDRGVLVQTTGLLTGRVLPLSLDRVTIGKSPDCTIVLADEDAAPVHAVVLREGYDLVVERAGGPIALDDVEVERATLMPGARVHLVSATFRYQLVDANEEAALTTVFESSVRDGLTGAFNAKHLVSLLEGEVAFVRRRHEPLAVLMLDVVGMRAMNLAHGYACGDEVLKHVVALAREHAGDAPVFRSAGDEVALVLREGAVVTADRLAERIAAAIAASPIPTGDGAVAVRVRCRVVALDETESGADLVERARASLRSLAQREGRGHRGPLAHGVFVRTLLLALARAVDERASLDGRSPPQSSAPHRRRVRDAHQRLVLLFLGRELAAGTTELGERASGVVVEREAAVGQRVRHEPEAALFGLREHLDRTLLVRRERGVERLGVEKIHMAVAVDVLHHPRMDGDGEGVDVAASRAQHRQETAVLPVGRDHQLIDAVAVPVERLDAVGRVLDRRGCRRHPTAIAPESDVRDVGFERRLQLVSKRDELQRARDDGDPRERGAPCAQLVWPAERVDERARVERAIGAAVLVPQRTQDVALLAPQDLARRGDRGWWGVGDGRGRRRRGDGRRARGRRRAHGFDGGRRASGQQHERDEDVRAGHLGERTPGWTLPPVDAGGFDPRIRPSEVGCGMTAQRWSPLLAREIAALVPLVSACATAPTPEPAPPTSAPPPAQSVSSPPVRPPTGLGSLVTAFSAAPTQTRPVRRERTVLRFGDSELVHEAVDWRIAAPACPLVGDEGCGLFALRRTGGAWTSAVRSPHAWSAFSPGRAVVYAARDGESLAIDTIDERGTVTPWLEDPTALDRTRVVETSRGAFIVGYATSNGFSIAAVEPGEHGHRKAPLVPLGIDTVEARPNAQGARFIESEGRRVSWGPLIPVPLLDDRGAATARWALAWVQVVPPPYGFPAGKAFHRREKRKAKHDCGGGPLSRGLADPSVEKRITLTVFEGTKQVSEVVVDRPERLELGTSAVRATAVPGGVAIQGTSYDVAGRKLAIAEPAAPTAPDLITHVPLEEEPTGLAFDVATGEGAALFRRGDEETIGRRVDATGAFVGEPLALPDGVGAHSDRVRLVKVDGVWLAFDPAEGVLAWLGGPHAGTSVTVPATHAAALVRVDDTHAALVLDGEHVQVVSIDVRAKTVSPAEQLPVAYTHGAFRRHRDGATIVVEATTGRFFNLGTREMEDGDFKVNHVIDVGGDTVVSWVGPKAVTLKWASSGESTDIPLASYPAPREAWTGAAGPLLPAGLAIPWSSGAPVETGIKPLPRACPYTVATAPGVVVMACAEPTSALEPLVRTGLRRVVY